MSSPPENRMLGIMRRESDLLVPLSRVREKLQADPEEAPLDGAVLTYLRRRPDLFLVLTADRALPGLDAWPAELRTHYADVLESEILQRETHVVLRESVANDGEPGMDLLHHAQRTLLQLWTQQDHEGRTELVAALELISDLDPAAR